MTYFNRCGCGLAKSSKSFNSFSNSSSYNNGGGFFRCSLFSIFVFHSSIDINILHTHTFIHTFIHTHTYITRHNHYIATGMYMLHTASPTPLLDPFPGKTPAHHAHRVSTPILRLGAQLD